MSKKIRMGMVGGSLDAFIGDVHRKASALDGQFELVCGAFSSSPVKSAQTGRALGLEESGVYGMYDEVIEKEAELSEEERMEVVSIVTPNHVHFGPAKKSLEKGFHVIIDKPLAFSLEEARILQQVVQETGNILALTHTSTGYPMIKEAHHLIQKGEIGKVRKIYVKYPYGSPDEPQVHN